MLTGYQVGSTSAQVMSEQELFARIVKSAQQGLFTLEADTTVFVNAGKAIVLTVNGIPLPPNELLVFDLPDLPEGWNVRLNDDLRTLTYYRSCIRCGAERTTQSYNNLTRITGCKQACSQDI